MPMPSSYSISTNSRPLSCVKAQVNVRSCLSFDKLWSSHPLNWVDSYGRPRREPCPFKKKSNPSPAELAEPEKLEGLYEDQCAIKMSIALQEAGLSIQSFRGATERRMVHRLNKPMRGALRAEELAHWLVSALGKPKQHAVGFDALMAMKNKRGLVFFKDFWRRGVDLNRPGSGESERNRSGDHIDLWFEDHVPAMPPVDYQFSDETGRDDRGYQRNRATGLWWPSMFHNARSVWFWELR